ncbi:MAG: hypothetical protein J5838_04045 [Desulfovibrio sp.]|nr:hypothetical protein [Desulfovibrio sp.]
MMTADASNAADAAWHKPTMWLKSSFFIPFSLQNNRFLKSSKDRFFQIVPLTPRAGYARPFFPRRKLSSGYVPIAESDLRLTAAGKQRYEKRPEKSPLETG